MSLFGLIGHPVSHSYSKDFFTRYFLEQGLTQHQYELFDLPQIELFPECLIQRKPAGLNVTIPHKESVLRYINHLDPVAEEIGAVNCLKMVENRIFGFNTDYLAFRETIENLQLPVGIAALVFGTGGAARAILTVFNHLRIPYQQVSRTPGDHQLAYEQLQYSFLQEHLLLINCTPVGMWPSVEDRLPLPYEFIGPKHIAYDLIYNPGETGFLRECRIRGAKTINGASMLEKQALYSWEIWNRKE